MARRELGDASGPAVELVDESLENAELAMEQLRDLAHGILPAALNRGGLRAGIETLAERIRLPLTLDVTAERFPPALEATAYFIVAEALTNVVKHAHADRAEVDAHPWRTARSMSRCATTAWGAPGSSAAPGCSGSRTGPRRSTASSAWTARPATAPWSRPRCLFPAPDLAITLSIT